MGSSEAAACTLTATCNDTGCRCAQGLTERCSASRSLSIEFQLVGSTYQVLVLDGLLLGVCDYSPLEEPCLLLRPVLLDVTFPVLRLRAYLLVYLVGFQVRDYLEIDHWHLIILLDHHRGVFNFIHLTFVSMCPTCGAAAMQRRRHGVIAFHIYRILRCHQFFYKTLLIVYIIYEGNRGPGDVRRSASSSLTLYPSGRLGALSQVTFRCR